VRLNKMTVTYNRTMTLTYEIDGTPLESPIMQRKFVADLRKTGMAVNSKYAYASDLVSSKYGFTEKMKGSDNYTTMVNGNEVFSSWNERTVTKLTNLLCEALSGDNDVSMEQTESQKKVKQWARIEGKVCYFDKSPQLDGTASFSETSPDKVLIYGENNEITMEVQFGFGYGEMTVKFDINWDAKKIQKKKDIEAMVVDTPLNDMGRIQKIVERIAGYKKNGVNVDNPSIECHFDAKTESRSECAPDIIAKVREARKTA